MRLSYQGIPNVIFLQECSRYGCTATIYFSYFFRLENQKTAFFYPQQETNGHEIFSQLGWYQLMLG
jgi:hypothetical protein